jgi:hypothetical protein
MLAPCRHRRHACLAGHSESNRPRSPDRLHLRCCLPARFRCRADLRRRAASRTHQDQLARTKCRPAQRADPRKHAQRSTRAESGGSTSRSRMFSSSGACKNARTISSTSTCANDGTRRQLLRVETQCMHGQRFGGMLHISYARIKKLLWSKLAVEAAQACALFVSLRISIVEKCYEDADSGSHAYVCCCRARWLAKSLTKPRERSGSGSSFRRAECSGVGAGPTNT